MLLDNNNISTLNNFLQEYKLNNENVNIQNINFLVFLGEKLIDITPDDCIGYVTMPFHELSVGQKFQNPYGNGILTIKHIDLDTETILVDLQYV